MRLNHFSKLGPLSLMHIAIIPASFVHFANLDDQNLQLLQVFGATNGIFPALCTNAKLAVVSRDLFCLFPSVFAPIGYRLAEELPFPFGLYFHIETTGRAVGGSKVKPRSVSADVDG